MTLGHMRTIALALGLLAAGSVGASAQSDGSGGTSGGSSTGGVGWTPTPPDGGAESGSDKKNSNPSTSGDDRSATSGPSGGDQKPDGRQTPDGSQAKPPAPR